MNCNEFRLILAEWLEEAWDTESPAANPAPAQLAAHASNCDICSAKLIQANALVKYGHIPATPSPFLASRIKSAINSPEVKTGRSKVSFSPGVAKGLTAAAAVLAVVLLFFLTAGNRSGNGEITVTFKLHAPQAGNVHVVGDWNGWDPAADPLTDGDGDGIWEAEVRLIPGSEYRYQFFVDEEKWIADPEAPLSIDDGFGGTNSILSI